LLLVIVSLSFAIICMYAGLADLDPANSKKPIAHAGSKRKEPEALLDAVNPNDDEEGPGADVTETTAESVLDAVLPASDDAATADDTSDETTAVAPGKGGATAETETSTTEGDSLLESASEGIFGMLGGGDGEATTSVAPTKGYSTAEAKTAATEGTDNAADGEGTTPAPTTSETEATEAAAETPETETTEGEGLLGFIIPDVIDGGGGDETTTSMAPTKGDSTAEAETAATEGTDDPEGSDEATEEDDGASVNEETRSGEGATKGDGIAPGIAARLKTVAAHVAEHSKQLSDIAVGKTVRRAFRVSPVMAAVVVAAGELEPNSLRPRFHRCRRLLSFPSSAGCATTLLSSRPSGRTRRSWIRRASK
jgi:hypothetical protein